ncbi:hypothetical protein D3C87_142840 [compost metagenome]
MKQELIALLLEWERDINKTGERQITYMKLPNNEEYIITFKEDIKIHLNNKSKHVSITKNLRTFAQSDKELNPKGDIYRIKQLIQIIEQEFLNKYSEALDEIFLNFEGESSKLE